MQKILKAQASNILSMLCLFLTMTLVAPGA